MKDSNRISEQNDKDSAEKPGQRLDSRSTGSTNVNKRGVCSICLLFGRNIFLRTRGAWGFMADVEQTVQKLFHVCQNCFFVKLVS
jgi:hypothetical protein